MAAKVLASRKRYYGTAAEINALSANKGDLGYASDEASAEYTNTDGATTWVLTAARPGEFDNLFHMPVTLDVSHHEIHEGDTYSASLADSSAATGESIQGYILTPAVTSPQKRMHMILSHEGSGLHTFTLTEGVTFTSGGAASVPVNRRRDSANTTAAQTVTAGGDNLTGGLLLYTGGTVIWTESAGSGRGIEWCGSRRPPRSCRPGNACGASSTCGRRC